LNREGQVKKAILKLVNDHNFLSLAANFSTAAMGLLSFIILMRMLSIEDFGKWVLFTAPASLLDMLRFGLSKEALVRYLSSPGERERKYYLGSSWIIAFLILLVITVILWSFTQIIPGTLRSSGYDVFFYWYPILALVNLPWNYAWTIFQAEMEFGRIFWIRFFNLCSFLVIILLAYLFFKINITVVVLIYILTHAATSLFCIFRKWTGLEYLRRISKEKMIEILRYGQYSMGTKVGSSLLKGADSFIISFSAYCGPVGVALYAIPLKFVELIEIPLISFATTAFPKLSKASLENNTAEFKRIFYSYTGAIAYLFAAIALVSLVFNKLFIILLGGHQYMESLNEISYIMLIFIAYTLMLPLDRFTGVALDSLNKPKRNFQKVVYMTLANIVGDVVAVFGLHYLFPEWPVTTLLIFVALASVIFTLLGMFLGYRFLKQEVDIKFREIFRFGYIFYKEHAIVLMNKRKGVKT
jgi:O-antigen/teichoic acid export membrane protein